MERNVLFSYSLNIFCYGYVIEDYFMGFLPTGARCSSVVRAFAHGAMGRRIDPSWAFFPQEQDVAPW